MLYLLGGIYIGLGLLAVALAKRQRKTLPAGS